jgi:hypothetical protein
MGDLTKCTELIFTFDFYSKDGKLLLTITNQNAITPITGIRPLGLRKNGIIINPIESNEDLIMENTEEKVAQRINAKTYKYGTNIIRGTILQGRAATEKGAPLEKSLKPLIEYEEQLNGRSGFDGSGKYLFDGQHLPTLNNWIKNGDVVDDKYDKATMWGLPKVKDELLLTKQAIQENSSSINNVKGNI